MGQPKFSWDGADTWEGRVEDRLADLERRVMDMAKRYNWKKMSHGKKDLERPVKKPRQESKPTQTKRKAAKY